MEEGEEKRKRERKERGKKEKGKIRKKKQCVGEKKEKGERENKDFPSVPTIGARLSSIVRILKLVHATRVTRGYRNLNFLSKL